MVITTDSLRRGFLAMCVAALAAMPCAADDGAAPQANGASRREQLFFDAARAYNENRLDDAVADYRQLIDNGYISPELFYNYGNALFRAGRTAEAVLYYRKAWVLSPSDPDIEANLNFALRRAGAPPPRMHALRRAASAFSLQTWIVLALSLYWVATIGFIAYLLTGRRYRHLAHAAAAFIAAAAICAGPIAYWIHDRIKPEAVITEARTALYAPLDNATEHFSLPNGALVRILERNGDWVKITYRGNAGWIAQNDCIPVWPL